MPKLRRARKGSKKSLRRTVAGNIRRFSKTGRGKKLKRKYGSKYFYSKIAPAAAYRAARGKKRKRRK